MSREKIGIVAGGSGGIGEGIVLAMLNQGYRIYVPTRDGDQSPRLREYVGADADVHMVPADLGEIDQVESLRDTILEKEGRIDTVIVSVGSYYYGHRMHRMTMADWKQTIEDNLTTHFNMQRAFVSLFREQSKGTYIVLTGPEADAIVPDEQVMSIMAAAQRMMARVVAHEAFDSPIRVYSITARTAVATRSRDSQQNQDWIPARDLGSYVAALVAGIVPGIHETQHEIRDRRHLDTVLNDVRRRT